MTDKVTGLCAPTAMQRKVRGYIFKHRAYDMYYLEFMKGFTKSRAFAHVYTAKEAKESAQQLVGWGVKTTGKWYIIYE